MLGGADIHMVRPRGRSPPYVSWPINVSHKKRMLKAAVAGRFLLIPNGSSALPW
jgi:hypothetical protein